MIKIFRENQDWLVFEGDKESLTLLAESLLKTANGEPTECDNSFIDIDLDAPKVNGLGFICVKKEMGV
jgi:hypothetical protein